MLGSVWQAIYVRYCLGSPWGDQASGSASQIWPLCPLDLAPTVRNYIRIHDEKGGPRLQLRRRHP